MIRIRHIISVLLVVLAGSQCGCPSNQPHYKSIREWGIYRAPRSHRFVVAFLAQELDPNRGGIMTGAKLVGATLHLVGCDADSGRVAELATIPFLALENDQFGFRVDGWKGETLY